jgi:hypothetical protein
MLDLTKLAGQMPGISQHFKREAIASGQRLERAQSLLAETAAQQRELVERYQQWRDRLIFSAAIPVEPLETRITIAAPPARYSVFATDGSQIAPSHHEIAYCYLINIGRVMLHYGQNLHPLLDNVPEIHYKPEDLYVSKHWGIRVEEWMGHRRTVLEMQMLAEMACSWVKPPGAHYEPNLALVDGSLIYWFIENLPLEAKERILPPMLEAWSQLKQAQIPLIGYLSGTRSIEATNFLRLTACPYETPNCMVNCSEIMEDKTPCQVITPLRDATLWSYILAPGERGALWRSNSRILSSYEAQHWVYFCYVNVGSEIARIEFPAWVAEDSKLLEQSFSILLGQVSKGYGYPISLSEAHNQAVVRSGDRARFFALLEQQMVKVGLQNVGLSSKESRKRSSIA